MLKEKSLEVFTKKTQKQSAAFSFTNEFGYGYIGCGRYMIESADTELATTGGPAGKVAVSQWFKAVLDYKTFFELDMNKLLRYLKALNSVTVELDVDNCVLTLHDLENDDYISFNKLAKCNNIAVGYIRKELIDILIFLKQNTPVDKRKVTFCFETEKLDAVGLNPTCLITETAIKAIVAPVRL